MLTGDYFQVNEQWQNTCSWLLYLHQMLLVRQIRFLLMVFDAWNFRYLEHRSNCDTIQFRANRSSSTAQQCSGTLTITASADVSALASCTTYSGSVVIPTGLAVPKDENGHQSLELTKVEKITGNLSITNIDALTELHMDSIKALGGMELTNLTQLITLSIQQLQTVDKLGWSALPALQSWGGSGLSEAKSILITNTGLATLDNLVNLGSVDYFNINNNPALTNISLKVTKIGTSLDIEANDDLSSGLSTSFPMLETAQNMTFRNCSEILLPVLKNVTDELGFYGNGFQSFNAPKLSTVGGIVFVDNTDLTNVSLPQLSSINGTCLIANNTQFKSINGFPKLSVITGDVSFSGNFTE